MWFDAHAALRKIEGGLAATPATPATNEAAEPNSNEFVAKIANVAVLPPAQKTSPKSADADEFEERAAIAEFDGGLTRNEAEQLAARSQGYDNVVAFKAAQSKATKTSGT